MRLRGQDRPIPDCIWNGFQAANDNCNLILVSCSRNPLNNLGVIPGKLAIAIITRPGIQENQKLLDTRFRGYDGGALAHLFCGL